MYREEVSERSVTLRPRVQSASGRGEARHWNNTMRMVMRLATASTRGRKRSGFGTGASKGHSGAQRAYQQRVAVRITYSNRKIAGLWRAHGVYLQRESASGEIRAAFSETEKGVDLAARLDDWQKAKDPRLFKLILSPEFGERLDLENYTKETMSRIEQELGRRLQWAAITHHNTEHPHIHIALRSLDQNGHEIVLPKEFVKQTARAIAQEVGTEHLGYRTELDAQHTREREISQNRVTSLDRDLDRLRGISPEESDHFVIMVDLPAAPQRDRERIFALQRRLVHLQEVGLAQRTGAKEWSIDSQFVDKLRTIQQAGDRQKSMARHMAVASAPNLPIVVDHWDDVSAIRGRILGHGEEEISGKHYFLLEATDGKIHYLAHRKETEIERHKGGMKPNTFVSLRNSKSVVHMYEYGDAEKLLDSERFLSREPGGTHLHGDLPGWLGRYAQAVSRDRTFEQHAQQEEDVSMPLKMPEAVKKLFGTHENEKAEHAAVTSKTRDSLLTRADAPADKERSKFVEEVVPNERPEFQALQEDLELSLNPINQEDKTVEEEPQHEIADPAAEEEEEEEEDRDFDDYDPIADIEERDPDDDLDVQDDPEVEFTSHENPGEIFGVATFEEFKQQHSGLTDEELLDKIYELEERADFKAEERAYVEFEDNAYKTGYTQTTLSLNQALQHSRGEREEVASAQIKFLDASENSVLQNKRTFEAGEESYNEGAREAIREWSLAPELEEQYRRTIDDLAFGPRDSVNEALQDSNKAQELTEQRAVPAETLLPDPALTVDLVHSEQEYEANSVAEIEERDPLDSGSSRAKEQQLAYELALDHAGEGKPAFEPDREHGGYVGEIVAETDNLLVQEDNGRWIIHDKHNLSQTPEIGSHAIVQYDPALEKAKVLETPQHLLETGELEV